MKKPLTNFVETYFCTNIYITRCLCYRSLIPVTITSFKESKEYIHHCQFCQESSTVAVRHPKRCQVNLLCKGKK